MSIFKAPNFTPSNPFAKFQSQQTPEQRIEAKASSIASNIRKDADAIKRELRGNRPDDAHFNMMRELESQWRKEDAERNHNTGMLRVLKGFQHNREQGVKNDRTRINNFMKSYGYKWQPFHLSTEEDTFKGGYYGGIGEYAGTRWDLYAPDGRKVSIDTALAEIEAIISEKI